jgi:hypothetical protein
MMKKVMFVVLALVFAVSAFAQTSNKVGFVKFNCPVGATAFGLPFEAWQVTGGIPTYGTASFKPSSVIGAQLNEGNAFGTTGDKIAAQVGGTSAWILSSSHTWTGTMESGSTLTPGNCFWVQNRSAAAYDVVLAGQVHNGGYTPGQPINVPGALNSSVPVSWREARILAPSTLGLMADGFTGGNPPFYNDSDKLVCQNPSTSAYVNVAGTFWGGTLTGIIPGKAYWIQQKHAGHPWTYTYDSPPALSVVGDDGSENPSLISKAPMNFTKAAPAATVKTAPASKTGSSKSATQK